MRSVSIHLARGFTLIELMIAVLVVGILSTLALPSFEAQVHKARRADLLVTTLQVQMAQERLRSHATSYGALADIGMGHTTAARHYTLQMVANDAEGFELLATATGAQARDTACRYMKLASTQLNVVHTSGPDAQVTNPAAANRRCWSL